MPLDNLKILLELAGAFGIGAVVAGLIVFFLLKSFIPSYLSKKAENLATREDIAAITNKVEMVKAQYATLQEELKAKHQLRLAAIDRRLQAHQESFTLWRELIDATHTADVSDVVFKCQEWWERNCLYLEPNVRQSFVQAYSAAHSHHGLVTSRSDVRLVTQNWSRIMAFSETLFNAMQLPVLNDVEAKPIPPHVGAGDG